MTIKIIIIIIIIKSQTYILKPPISVVPIYPLSVIFTLEDVLFSVFHDSTTSITVKTFFIIYYEDLSFSRVSLYCMFQMKK